MLSWSPNASGRWRGDRTFRHYIAVAEVAKPAIAEVTDRMECTQTHCRMVLDYRTADAPGAGQTTQARFFGPHLRTVAFPGFVLRKGAVLERDVKILGCDEEQEYSDDTTCTQVLFP